MLDNKFSEEDMSDCIDKDVRDVLEFYKIQRDSR